MTGVTSDKANGSYTTGEVIEIKVSFTEEVFVDTTVTLPEEVTDDAIGGTPYLEIETGDIDRNAIYVSGGGTDTLIFEYTVEAGDTSPDLNYKGRESLKPNGGTIRNATEKDATLTLVPSGFGGSLDAKKDIVIDTTAPAVENVASDKADGSYTSGEVIDITVTFSEAVTVDTSEGTPYLELETGASGQNAVYISGSDTDTLTFEYTVQGGDNSLDLDYRDTNSLNTNGGTIRDAAGNDAALTLASPGNPGSLGANNALGIETEDEDSSLWIWLVSIFGGLGLLLAIGIAVIIIKRRSARAKAKQKPAKRKARRR